MQVTSYNPHLGLLRSEHCWGEHRTVYSGRSEADVVMASINQACGLFLIYRLGVIVTVFPDFDIFDLFDNFNAA